MTDPTLTADDVADYIYRDVLRQRFMIITHGDTRWLYRLKRFAPEQFFRLLRKQAEAFANRKRKD